MGRDGVACGYARGLVAGRHDDATDALMELTATKIQQFWYPGFVQKELAATGSEKVPATSRA